MKTYFSDNLVSLRHTITDIHRLGCMPSTTSPGSCSALFDTRAWGDNVVRGFGSTLNLQVKHMRNNQVLLKSEESIPTCRVCTIREVSSSTASAADVLKALAPRCSPRTILPSFWNCSMGNQKRSRTPCTMLTTNTSKFTAVGYIKRFDIPSWTIECIGPTPAITDGS